MPRFRSLARELHTRPLREEAAENTGLGESQAFATRSEVSPACVIRAPNREGICAPEIPFVCISNRKFGKGGLGEEPFSKGFPQKTNRASEYLPFPPFARAGFDRFSGDFLELGNRRRWLVVFLLH
jgi:hypothetical protein